MTTLSRLTMRRTAAVVGGILLAATALGLLLALAACSPKEASNNEPGWAPIVVETDIPPYTTCEQAGGALASEDPGYNPELDPNGNGVMCEVDE